MAGASSCSLLVPIQVLPAAPGLLRYRMFARWKEFYPDLHGVLSVWQALAFSGICGSTALRTQKLTPPEPWSVTWANDFTQLSLYAHF